MKEPGQDVVDVLVLEYFVPAEPPAGTDTRYNRAVCARESTVPLAINSNGQSATPVQCSSQDFAPVSSPREFPSDRFNAAQ